MKQYCADLDRRMRALWNKAAAEQVERYIPTMRTMGYVRRAENGSILMAELMRRLKYGDDDIELPYCLVGTQGVAADAFVRVTVTPTLRQIERYLLRVTDPPFEHPDGAFFYVYAPDTNPSLHIWVLSDNHLIKCYREDGKPWIYEGGAYSPTDWYLCSLSREDEARVRLRRRRYDDERRRTLSA